MSNEPKLTHGSLVTLRGRRRVFCVRVVRHNSRGFQVMLNHEKLGAAWMDAHLFEKKPS